MRIAGRTWTSTIRPLAIAAVASGLAVAGCAADAGGSSGSSGGGSSGGSSGEDSCAAVSRFSNSLEVLLSSIEAGDTDQLSGERATVKDQYISLSETTSDEAPAETKALEDASADLDNALSRVVPNTAPDQVQAKVQPQVDAVTTSIDDLNAKLGCSSA
jgi:hypothetical protein